MPFLHNDTENNFQIGKYCLRQEVRAEEGRCGDQAAWRQPVARGAAAARTAKSCSSVSYKYDVDYLDIYSDILKFFQLFYMTITITIIHKDNFTNNGK